MGSLGFAIRSAVAGHQVTVFEANSYPGGKLAQIKTNGFRFDAGPSLFTMPHLVDELFTLAGKNPRDYFSYERLPEICRYFWEDGTRLQTNAAPAETAAAIASELGESEENVARFLREIGKNYHIISDLFLDNSLHSLSTWTGRKALKGYLNIPRLGLFNTMHRSHAKRFTNPKTVQLFDRYATYNGSDPYQTPATLSLCSKVVQTSFFMDRPVSVQAISASSCLRMLLAFRPGTFLTRVLESRSKAFWETKCNL